MENPGVLPAPEPLLRHHGVTLDRSLRQWLEQDRLPPVLLITGPSGIGKRSVVYHLSQWILCERTGFRPKQAEEEVSLFGDAAPAAELAPIEQRLAPCGECLHCVKALKHTWVDFTEIASEEEALKIDQFRKLKATLGFGAFDGAYRITFIRDADRMTPQAANSLLKILEEPPPGWIFFLTAADPSLLLPTLVSRCQRLRLQPLGEDTIRELLKLGEVPAERQAVAAKLAQGSWTRAIKLADPEIWDQRAAVFRFLERPQVELNALVDWAAQEDSHFQFLLDQLEQASEDLIRWSTSREAAADYAWRNLDGQRSLEAHALDAIKRMGSAREAREFWTRRAERLFRARIESLAPLNRKLLIQDILIAWMAPHENAA
jgi:DNA polymerase-3 subunit delta'